MPPHATATDPLAGETLISVADVCQRYPGRDGGGKKLHFRTVLRWIHTGTRNAATGETVRLEAVKAGGRHLTSLEALARYHERLARPTPGPATPPTTGAAGRKRLSREQQAINDALDRMGA